MKVLYEDKFLIAVEKPAAVLSEPSPGGEDVLTLAKEMTGHAAVKSIAEDRTRVVAKKDSSRAVSPAN